MPNAIEQSGQLINTVGQGEQPVTSAAWAPDGRSFVTGSMDNQYTLHLWDSSGGELHSWANKRRVQDLAISPDGQRLVTISPEKQISVYNFVTREEEYTMQFKTELTCVNISRDSKYMLVNMAEELQLIDINNPTETVRRFDGQKQGEWIIRSCFGGADENLVISGSEGKASFRFST